MFDAPPFSLALVAVGLLTGRAAVPNTFWRPTNSGLLVFFSKWAAARSRSLYGCWLSIERPPTRVADAMTVNPIAAGLLATQLVGEPIHPQSDHWIDRCICHISISYNRDQKIVS